MRLARSSGIFLHPTSLPGGRLGREAYRFVDWLEAAGQSWWQVLPLGPPDEEGSPTEVRGGLDIAFRAHLDFKSRAALVAEYSWRHMGTYFAGELFQAGFTLSLVIGPSR